MTNLTDKLDDLLHWVHHTEYKDVVEAIAVGNGKGGYVWYLDPLKVEDPSKVRINRVLAEFNERAIPAVEDDGQIRADTIRYRREITRFCGMVIEDRPVLERMTLYRDGHTETREIDYSSGVESKNGNKQSNS